MSEERYGRCAKCGLIFTFETPRVTLPHGQGTYHVPQCMSYEEIFPEVQE